MTALTMPAQATQVRSGIQSMPGASEIASASRLQVRINDAEGYGRDLKTFLDVVGAATGRATHYNTRAEQVSAELAAHENLFRHDRTLYGLLLTLSGNTDRSMQIGLVRLLADRQNGGALEIANGDVIEEAVIQHIVDALPIHRLVKMAAMLREAKVNNGRARRIVLTSLLKAEGLELRAVRYRGKMAEALRILGRRELGVVRSLALKGAGAWSDAERTGFRQRVGRYSRAGTDLLADVLGYVLGTDRTEYGERTPLIRQVFAARRDLALGKDLPLEVLEGIRGQFHKDTPSAKVLELVVKDVRNLTKGQRMAVQAKAEKAGVEVAFDPMTADAVKLYVYAFERGMSPEIEAALDAKAEAAASAVPYRFGKVGILLDASRSMMGSGEQKLRPIAVALAVRDVLARTAGEAVVHVGGGRAAGRLARPEGDTDLSEGLVVLLRAGVDAIHVVTDGYENAPAGRFAETVLRVWDLGLKTPIFQFSPVVAAESSGLRTLLGGETAIAVSNPQALGSQMFVPMLAQDPILATKVLVENAVRRLGQRLEMSGDAQEAVSRRNAPQDDEAHENVSQADGSGRKEG